MSELIYLSDLLPHEAFKAFCGSCGYKWIAVQPDGVSKFGVECNSCGSMSGFATGEDLE